VIASLFLRITEVVDEIIHDDLKLKIISWSYYNAHFLKLELFSEMISVGSVLIADDLSCT
jgi:hypothetical protein